jgi:peptidoglycan/xylan/chitin deacetylase (PgdA/CDA1 family)
MQAPASPPLPLRMPLSLLSPHGRRGRLLIFTYHRVLAQPDPLLPDEADAASFAAHMDWVREFCNVLPLPEAVRRLRDGSLPSRATCITFDDGYANNYEVARPILLQRGVTATVFIAVDAVERGIMWNDLVIESVRQAGGRLDAAHLAAIGYRGAALSPGSAAESVNRALDALKYRPMRQRWEAAAELYRQVAQREPPRLMMTPDTVRAFGRDGFDIGAHTVNHPILATQTEDEARFEVRASRDWVAQVTGSAPVSFAYPNGRPGRDYDDSHARMVRDAGYELAVTTAWGCASGRSDVFQLPRVAFWDRTRRPFWARLVQTYARSYLPRAA